ncbi:unnamed protein product [Ixodes persulcatus]
MVTGRMRTAGKGLSCLSCLQRKLPTLHNALVSHEPGACTRSQSTTKDNEHLPKAERLKETPRHSHRKRIRQKHMLGPFLSARGREHNVLKIRPRNAGCGVCKTRP